MGFNSAFKGLIYELEVTAEVWVMSEVVHKVV